MRCSASARSAWPSRALAGAESARTGAYRETLAVRCTVSQGGNPLPYDGPEVVPPVYCGLKPDLQGQDYLGMSGSRLPPGLALTMKVWNIRIHR